MNRSTDLSPAPGAAILTRAAGTASAPAGPELEPIPFARPMLGEEEERAVLAVMRSGWLTTGAEAREFEREFAREVGAKHALAVNSATSGLHLALEALGVREGGRVITTPYTFAATAEVIRYLRADPLFVDVDEESCNLSPARLEEALEANRGRISAILPVHVAGLPCDMAAILELARRHGVPVVEDSAHAFPVRLGGTGRLSGRHTPGGEDSSLAGRHTPGGEDSSLAGRTVGTLGAAGVYSFYATKTITTGEGGMVVTDRDDLARRMSVMRLHGIDRDVWDRYRSPSASWQYQVIEPGFKYNLPDLAAAIGRVQLRRASAFLQARRRIASLYLEGLGDLESLRLPAPSDEHAWHLFLVRLRPERLRIGRDRFVAALQEAGIGVSVHFIPLHLMPYYRDLYHYREQDFPAAVRSFRSAFSLPIYPGLSGAQVERVVREVRRLCLEHGR